MQEISDKMGDNQFAKVDAVCIDCRDDFVLELERKSETDLEIKNGAIAKKYGTYLCKCQTCFDLNNNFGGETEVYSRVVGYLRPIGNWNKSKKQEFDLRKPYIVK